MNMNSEYLLNLPIETLAIIVSGYLGYKLAFTGRNKHHRPIDVVFISFGFGIVAKPIFTLLGNEILPLFISIITALILASVWRTLITEKVLPLLRTWNISTSDGHKSAFDTIRTRQSTIPTQLYVRTTSGKNLLCDSLNDFKDAPFGPCIYGEDGSIALYVTSWCDGENDWQDLEPRDGSEGIAITYIPANQIQEVEIKHL